MAGKLGQALKKHIVDTTGILAASHPIYSGFEVFLAGMQNSESVNARVIATGTA